MEKNERQRERLLKEREEKLSAKEQYLQGKKQRLRDKERQCDEKMKEREEKLNAREQALHKEWQWVQSSTGVIDSVQNLLTPTGVGEREDVNRSKRSTSIDNPSGNSSPVTSSLVAHDNSFPPVIKLNVGGQIFHTTLLTLTRRPESMIAAMFSGRHPLLRDENGCYFIDRNPREFDIILRFLRSGFMSWPVDEQEKECLSVELDYFGIEEPDLSWMLRTDGYGGFKQYPYHEDIYLAVSKETDWQVVQSKTFDCPSGFHWASTAEFKELIGSCTDDSKGYPYYDTGGWKGYVWEGKERIMFCFSDSKYTHAYKHSGHAPACYLHTGLTESFAGIVCVRHVSVDSC